MPALTLIIDTMDSPIYLTITGIHMIMSTLLNIYYVDKILHFLASEFSVPGMGDPVLTFTN